LSFKYIKSKIFIFLKKTLQKNSAVVDMKINNLIFSEIIKRGYKLDGRTRVWNLSDSKLWYLTPKQSQGFLNVEENPEYKKNLTETEINLIKENLGFFLSQMKAKTYNIIDIGCGNGTKASLFIGELSKSLNIRYCPVDISSYMVKKASQTIRELKIGDVLEFSWNISDFENLDNVTSLFRDYSYKHHLMLFLGNTMSNFSHNNILETIKKSMKKGDFLLIGNGITNDFDENLLKSYHNKSMIDFLIQPLELVGFKKNELEYNVRFVNSRVEMYFTLLKDKTIKHLGKTIDFKKGDNFLIGISYKYTKNDFKKILSNFFRKMKIITDENQTYALAFCVL
jgi:uncharacterized SAM-dependent methyltransferase